MHADGWVESEKPGDNFHETVATYASLFAANQVKAEYVDTLLHYVREWTNDGVAVYAFRPPANRAIRRVENSTSGFDTRTFAIRFTQAGGRWLNILPDKYPTYDGSHLTSQAARDLSRDLATLMRDTPPFADD
jgi:hypothetical protein